MFLSESKCRRRKVPRNLIVQFSGISAIFDLVSESADFLLSSVCNIVVFSLVFFFLRGWGLRCLDDIPMGTFVCTYAGQILNEDMANKVLLVFPCDYVSRSSLN